MTLSDQIEDLLFSLPGQPLSIAEMTARIPGSLPSAVEAACINLRERGRLGRNGADTVASPFRFYLKNNVRDDRTENT